MYSTKSLKWFILKLQIHCYSNVDFKKHFKIQCYWTWHFIKHSEIHCYRTKFKFEILEYLKGCIESWILKVWVDLRKYWSLKRFGLNLSYMGEILKKEKKIWVWFFLKFQSSWNHLTKLTSNFQIFTILDEILECFNKSHTKFSNSPAIISKLIKNQITSNFRFNTLPLDITISMQMII